MLLLLSYDFVRRFNLSITPILLSKPSGINASSGNNSPTKKMVVNGEVDIEDGSKSPNTKFPTNGSPYMAPKKGLEKGIAAQPGLIETNHQMPPTSVMTRLILIMVWRKLIRNPNTYSSLIGLIWSLISFRHVILLTN